MQLPCLQGLLSSSQQPAAHWLHPQEQHPFTQPLQNSQSGPPILPAVIPTTHNSTTSNSQPAPQWQPISVGRHVPYRPSLMPTSPPPAERHTHAAAGYQSPSRNAQATRSGQAVWGHSGHSSPHRSEQAAPAAVQSPGAAAGRSFQQPAGLARYQVSQPSPQPPVSQGQGVQPGSGVRIVNGLPSTLWGEGRIEPHVPPATQAAGGLVVMKNINI